MTAAEWNSSSDPTAMIRWLAKQGHVAQLWEFTIASCRRVWDELPGEAFRRVVQHAEQIGSHDIDDVLADASRAIDKLERRFSKASDETEQARLNRQIGYGRLVLAFDHQDAAGAATDVSQGLLAWANDTDDERRGQGNLLRLLVPDPSEVSRDDNDA